jgi:hypothetical protein
MCAHRFARLAILGVLCGTWACQSRITKPTTATVQGCLAHNAEGYTLTENSGQKYFLTGNSAILNPQVGHEVLIRGELVQSRQSPGAPPAANHGSQSRVDVSEVQSVSDKCG